MLLRCLGWRKKREHHTLAYVHAVVKTDLPSIEATVRRRKILFAGFVARIGEERVPSRVMFGETIGGKGYSFGQEKDWMGRIEDFRGFDIKSKGWRRETAQTASKWLRWVEEGAEAYMTVSYTHLTLPTIYSV